MSDLPITVPTLYTKTELCSVWFTAVLPLISMRDEVCLNYDQSIVNAPLWNLETA